MAVVFVHSHLCLLVNCRLSEGQCCGFFTSVSSVFICSFFFPLLPKETGFLSIMSMNNPWFHCGGKSFRSKSQQTGKLSEGEGLELWEKHHFGGANQDVTPTVSLVMMTDHLNR